MNILFFGFQGSGKSTHAKYIAEKLNLPYIYTGDLFRKLEDEDSERGNKIRELMAKGVLIPNEVSIPAFEEYIREFDISNGLVLDGYPRNIEQAEKLPFKLDIIVHVNLPEKVAIKRLSERGRYDDTPAVIKKRLEFFKKQTDPLYEYFREKGVKIVEIDNSPPVEQVREVLDDVLKER